MRKIVFFVIIAGLAYPSLAQAQSPELWYGPIDSRYVPWVEINRSDRSGVMATVVNGLRRFRPLTGHAIVSTVPGYGPIYDLLPLLSPGIRIIPGLKTSSMLPRLDSVQGWNAVSREVRILSDHSRSGIVLLEMESAMREFVEGRQTINLNRLRQGLNKLPPDLIYIWYPSVSSVVREKRSRQEQIVRAAAEGLNLILTTQRYNRPAALRSRGADDAQQRNEAIVSDTDLGSIPGLPTFMHMMYVHDVSPYWMNPLIRAAAVSSVPTPDVIILYPGYANWLRQSEDLTSILE